MSMHLVQLNFNIKKLKRQFAKIIIELDGGGILNLLLQKYIQIFFEEYFVQFCSNNFKSNQNFLRISFFFSSHKTHVDAYIEVCTLVPLNVHIRIRPFVGEISANIVKMCLEFEFISTSFCPTFYLKRKREVDPWAEVTNGLQLRIRNLSVCLLAPGPKACIHSSKPQFRPWAVLLAFLAPGPKAWRWFSG